MRTALRAVQRRLRPPTRNEVIGAVLLVAAVTSAVLIDQRDGDDPERREVAISQLLSDAQAGRVQAVTIDDTSRQAAITYVGEAEPSAVAGYPLDFGGDLASELTDDGVDVDAEPHRAPTRTADVALSLLPPVLVIGFLLLFLRGKGGLGVDRLGKGKSDAVSVPDTRFSVVAGLDEVVDELREVVELPLRPGRFDRRITVLNPDRGGRERILRLHLDGRGMHTDADLSSLARRTAGMSGDDLEHLVNLACMEAARGETDDILESHLDAALQVAMLGWARRSASVTERDRRITAWHEAGHALAALKLTAAGDPVSVTIVPRGASGGSTWMDGSEDDFLTRSEAEASLVVKMAGRSAEELLLDGDLTTGAAGDFQAATDLAVRVVVHDGMSDLGVAFRQPARLEGSQADLVASAVDRILHRALEASRALLAANATVLAAIAEALLVEETLHLDELRAPRAGGGRGAGVGDGAAA